MVTKYGPDVTFLDAVTITKEINIFVKCNFFLHSLFAFVKKCKKKIKPCPIFFHSFPILFLYIFLVFLLYLSYVLLPTHTLVLSFLQTIRSWRGKPVSADCWSTPILVRLYARAHRQQSANIICDHALFIKKI